jgi:hypothetical protein
MAKNAKNDAPVAKAKKPKSQKQIAKREQNIREAEARLARLKAQQNLVNAKRSNGVIGSDATIMRLVDAEERTREEQIARQYVESVLAGSHGERVRKFIGRGLSGGPCKVAQIVKNYLATQGFREAV